MDIQIDCCLYIRSVKTTHNELHIYSLASFPGSPPVQWRRHRCAGGEPGNEAIYSYSQHVIPTACRRPIPYGKRKI